MMRVFHRDRSGLKTMLGRERDEFRGVVVGYQEWAGQARRGREKPVMVERVMRTEARPCPLASRSVWRVDEECDVGAARVALHDLDAIALDNFDSVFDSHDVADASRKSFGIPAGA